MKSRTKECLRIVTLAMSLAAAGCADDQADLPDGNDRTSGAGGGDAGPSRVPPQSIHQPSAAGTASGPQHMLRFSFGTPAVGRSEGDNHHLSLGSEATGR